ncbi:MAG: sugar-binding transcriptional regulator [Candidatus Humimicrobiaceae bacterium]
MDNFAKNKLLSKVARLYYIENYLQKDIAKKLSLSRVAVSRLLSKAKAQKIVEIKINKIKGDYQDIELKIEEKFKINECVVVPSYDNDLNVFKEIADLLSNILDRMVVNNDYIGVSWGTSLGVISEYLTVEKKENIKVVPIIGGLGGIDKGINSNTIAKNFADSFGGISYVINCPAVLESVENKKLLENDSNINQIFKLSEKINIAVVGASDLGSESSLYKFSYYSKKDFDYLTKLGAVGVVNLGSIDKNGDHVPNVVDERTIALSIDKLKSIKNVILIAISKRKKDVIKAALKSKMIKVFLTDEETAKAILEDN